MTLAYLPDLRLHYTDQGPKTAPALILTHPLGLDLSVWAGMVPLLPTSLRVIAYDHRGHGQSDAPDPPYSMGALVRDAERLLDHLGVRDCVFLGHGMGGLVAQGLAIKRLDLVRAMILSNTAARLGHETSWRRLAERIKAEGLEPYLTEQAPRHFSRRFLAAHAGAALSALWENATEAGVIGCAAAVAGADFYTTTASLTLPTLVIACSNDVITPPDLVRETADLILGNQFHLMRGPGHLPQAEAPEAYAAVMTGFLRGIGHL